MSVIVLCRLCGRKCVTHCVNLAVPAHPAPWDNNLPCPGSGRTGLPGVSS